MAADPTALSLWSHTMSNTAHDRAILLLAGDKKRSEGPETHSLFKGTTLVA